MNKLEKYLKKHKIKKIEFIRGFQKDLNALRKKDGDEFPNWKESTIYSWINGNRNIPPVGAYYISTYLDGEIREEDLIYSTGRLKKIDTARSGSAVNKVL